MKQNNPLSSVTTNENGTEVLNNITTLKMSKNVNLKITTPLNYSIYSKLYKNKFYL